MATSDAVECDYCGVTGHSWHVHPEARRDVAVWQREYAAELAPFGDYRESAVPDGNE